MGPVTVLAGLSWGALFLLAPVALATGAVFDITAMGPAERATVGITLLHLGAYGGFIWLIGHAGPVFASQVGYVVTATGVVLGMALFGERHSLWVWGALGLLFAGIALVKPRRAGATIPAGKSR
jgi:drug/metabolite transporter (DMT)-like permease